MVVSLKSQGVEHKIVKRRDDKKIKIMHIGKV